MVLRDFTLTFFARQGDLIKTNTTWLTSLAVIQILMKNFLVRNHPAEILT